MMKQTISSPIRKLRLLLVLPLIAGVFYAFAAPEYKFIQAEELATNANQNEKTIKGKVSDEDGNPLKGASVNIAGKTIGTITDDDGNFMLKVTDDSPIMISYVGFESVKVNPDFEREMKIILKGATISIKLDNQAPAIAKEGPIDLMKSNGTSKKGASNSSVGKVTQPKLKIDSALIIIDGIESPKFIVENMNPDNIESVNVLTEKSAINKYGKKGRNGVVEIIRKKEGNIYGKKGQIKISGYSEENDEEMILNPNPQIKFKGEDIFENKPEPLIIMDGIITKNQELNAINPETFESVKVLKGELATAKYGEKGKNGVVEITTKKTEAIFTVVEALPEFPGGKEALNAFVYSTMKYPVIALENGIYGQVFVKFVVDKTGKVTNAKISRGVDPSLDKEALRIVNSMPKWIPGQQNGEAVDVAYELPITFTIQVDYHRKNIVKLKEMK